ncbi:MAG: hypothetical protein KDA47_03440, partial [Planctomycetales bacterium]|nr:hypothetical protein [Planctomycetales bacterium]
KLVHLDDIVREPQKTGSLETSVADQVARFAQRISSLPQRRAFVRVRDRAAEEIESLDVSDPFRSPEAQARAVDWIKRRLYDVQPYYFTPCLDDDEQRRRLDAFVGDETAEADTVDFRSRPNDSNPLL